MPWGVGPVPGGIGSASKGQTGQHTTHTNMNWKKYLLALAFILGAALPMFAQTDITFPTLPSGDSWVTGLKALFISAAAVGLGILGLKYVIRMLSAGLAKMRGK